MNRAKLIEFVDAETTNPDIEGAEYGSDGSKIFDRRYRPEAAKRLGLNPRIADLNIIGQTIVRLTDEEAKQLRITD